MQTIILVIHLLLALALVGVVLLQRSEGGLGGLGGAGPSGGMGGLIGGRAAANLLTRATAILAGLFFATSILLAVLANTAEGPLSILDSGATTEQSAPLDPNQPAGSAAPTQPAAPAAPATPSVPTGE